MSRITLDHYFLNIAGAVSLRSTCHRRMVGCALVNFRGRLLSTGYNGVAAGLPHCRGGDRFCEGISAPSGTNLDACDAVHAEQNALVQCPDAFAIQTAYVTTSPCVTCVKSLLGTSCRRIVFIEEYNAPRARELWESSELGRSWKQITREELGHALGGL